MQHACIPFETQETGAPFVPNSNRITPPPPHTNVLAAAPHDVTVVHHTYHTRGALLMATHTAVARPHDGPKIAHPFSKPGANMLGFHQTTYHRLECVGPSANEVVGWGVAELL